MLKSHTKLKTRIKKYPISFFLPIPSIEAVVIHVENRSLDYHHYQHADHTELTHASEAAGVIMTFLFW